VVLDDVFEQDFTLGVVKVEFHTLYLAVDEIYRVVTGEVLLAVLDVLFVGEERDKLCVFLALLVLVVVDERTQGICPVYLDGY